MGDDRFRCDQTCDLKGTDPKALTNVPPERLAAEDISQTYALRWQVELLFKAMKSHGHLAQLPSTKKAAVD